MGKLLLMSKLDYVNFYLYPFLHIGKVLHISRLPYIKRTLTLFPLAYCQFFGGNALHLPGICVGVGIGVEILVEHLIRKCRTKNPEIFIWGPDHPILSCRDHHAQTVKASQIKWKSKASDHPISGGTNT